MEWIFFTCTVLLVLSGSPGTARGEEKSPIAGVGPRVERYRYEAIPTGRQNSEKELMEVEFVYGAGGVEYHSKVISSDSSEEISIHMDKEGGFLSARRSVAQGAGTPVQEERIWRDGYRVLLEKSGERGKKEKEVRLPSDKELAVDGSMLALLQILSFQRRAGMGFIYGRFFGGFDHRNGSPGGNKRISVPAGEFECYRLVTVVNIPLWKPRITYWLGTKKPHLLVRHEGKRGAFTPSYTTSLVSYE